MEPIQKQRVHYLLLGDSFSYTLRWPVSVCMNGVDDTKLFCLYRRIYLSVFALLEIEIKIADEYLHYY